MLPISHTGQPSSRPGRAQRSPPPRHPAPPRTADPRTDKSAKRPFHLTLILKPTTASDKRLTRRGGEMFREAVVRMAAISEAMGKRMKALGKLQRIFAREGRHTVDWLIQPK